MLEKADDLSNLIYAEIDYCIENEGLEYLSDYYIRRSAKALFSVDDVKQTLQQVIQYYASNKNLLEHQIQFEKERIDHLFRTTLIKF